MSLRLRIVIFLIILSFPLVQCTGHRKPHDLIPPKKYEKLLVEFQLLKAYQNMYQDSAKTIAIRKKILNHYHVTYNQFKQSHQYYMLNQTAEHKRLQQAMDQINEERDRIWNFKKYHENEYKKSKPKTHKKKSPNHSDK